MFRFPLENNQTELITNPRELLRLVRLTDYEPGRNENSPQNESRRAAPASQENVPDYGWPLKVSRHFAARIKPGNPTDPLLIQIMPSLKEKIKSPDFTRNPLKEQETACPNLLTKYSGRVLILTTVACAGACRFCFRRCFNQDRQTNSTKNSFWGNWNSESRGPIQNENITESPEKNQIPPQLLSAVNYIERDESVQEVLLSGGDPLMLDNEELSALLDRLAAIPHVRRIRIHSRLPIFYPPRIDAPLLNLFARLNRQTGTRQVQLFFVVHVNHGQEIDDKVAFALSALRQTGTVLLQQGVLLATVNDNPDTLVELYEKLANLGVIPYYLHQLDHVEGAVHFEVSDARARELIRTIRNLLPGFAVPLLVREYPDRGAKEPV